jgi:hypothetical protein
VPRDACSANKDLDLCGLWIGLVSEGLSLAHTSEPNPNKNHSYCFTHSQTTARARCASKHGAILGARLHKMSKCECKDATHDIASQPMHTIRWLQASTCRLNSCTHDVSEHSCAQAGGRMCVRVLWACSWVDSGELERTHLHYWPAQACMPSRLWFPRKVRPSSLHTANSR